MLIMEHKDLGFLLSEDKRLQEESKKKWEEIKAHKEILEKNIEYYKKELIKSITQSSAEMKTAVGVESFCRMLTFVFSYGAQGNLNKVVDITRGIAIELEVLADQIETGLWEPEQYRERIDALYCHDIESIEPTAYSIVEQLIRIDLFKIFIGIVKDIELTEEEYGRKIAKLEEQKEEIDIERANIVKQIYESYESERDEQ